MNQAKVIDLRSDTVTLPTPAMREAMFAAQVGDDVLGEDPTVNRLEAIAAERMGKERGLFVPSGTMANLVCLLTHCRRGDEAIMGDMAHTFLFEAGGSAVVGGIHPRTVRNQANGTLDPAEIEAAVRARGNPHYPPSRLICLENTHNRCSGAVLDPAYMSQIRALADNHGLAVHLDGARIFNAAAALGVSASILAREADSVSFCLSKGLSAPVGSMVCGPTEFIEQARRHRKLLGGGMRQAGVLAAAGIVALESMIDRLSADHANARRLAEGLSRLPGILLDPDRVPTNIVIFKTAAHAPSPVELVAGLEARDVKVGAIGGRRLRAVTHCGIDSEDVDRALVAASAVLAAHGEL
jgi:threonine aldolase